MVTSVYNGISDFFSFFISLFLSFYLFFLVLGFPDPLPLLSLGSYRLAGLNDTYGAGPGTTQVTPPPLDQIGRSFNRRRWPVVISTVGPGLVRSPVLSPTPPPQSQIKYVLCHFGRPLNVSCSDAANHNIPTLLNTCYAGESGGGSLFLSTLALIVLYA